MKKTALGLGALVTVVVGAAGPAEAQFAGRRGGQQGYNPGYAGQPSFRCHKDRVEILGAGAFEVGGRTIDQSAIVVPRKLVWRGGINVPVGYDTEYRDYQRYGQPSPQFSQAAQDYNVPYQAPMGFDYAERYRGQLVPVDAETLYSPEVSAAVSDCFGGGINPNREPRRWSPTPRDYRN